MTSFTLVLTGGPQVRFSIGAGDRQALQPPVSGTVPSSHNATALLFQQLGTYYIHTYCFFLKGKVFTFTQFRNRTNDVVFSVILGVGIRPQPSTLPSSKLILSLFFPWKWVLWNH